MTRIRVDASFEVVAALWESTSPESVITGTLSSEAGRLEFVTSPQFRHMDAEESENSFLSLGQEAVPVTIPALQGRVPDHYCSLFGLQQIDVPGVTDFGDNTKLTARRFRVASAVMGLHISCSESDEVAGATYSFTQLGEWLVVPQTIQTTIDSVTITQTRSILDLFRFSSIELQSEVTLEMVPHTQRNRHRGVFSHRSRIKVTPRYPRSVKWFASLAGRLENFLSLVLGTSIAVKEITLLKDGEYGSLVHRSMRRVEKADIESWIVCDLNVLALALSQWLGTPQQQRPIEQLLLSVVRKSKLFQETELLSLAQALEAFGRIKFPECLIDKALFKKGLVKIRASLRDVYPETAIAEKSLALLAHANEMSFGERLDKMYDLLGQRLAEDVVGSKPNFIRTVVQTRNYLTHVGIRKGGSVVTDARGLFLLNQRLAAFLRCVMLLDIGFSEAHVRDPIRYQAGRWS